MKIGLKMLLALCVLGGAASMASAMQTSEAYKERALKEYNAQQQQKCNELSLQIERELVRFWIIENQKSKTDINADECFEFVWQAKRALLQEQLDESSDEEECNEVDTFLDGLDSYSYFDV